MKTRYFSIFEKIKIFYSNSSLLTDKGNWLFLPPFLVLMMASSHVFNNIVLYNSNTYVYGTDVAVNSGKANSLHSDHTIAYTVNGKSYQVILTNRLGGIIKEKIKVKYLAKDPAISTAELLLSNLITDILLLSLFLLVFFGFLAYDILQISQIINILQNGEIALGKYLRSEDTNTKINKQTVMKMYFSFMDKYGKEQQTVAETHNTHKLQDEALEMLVYMPDNVGKSVFLDILPSFVRKKLESEFVKLKSKVL